MPLDSIFPRQRVHPRVSPGDAARRRRYQFARGSALHKGVEWALPFDVYAILVGSPCAYCRGPLNPSGIGLDRINPDGQYTFDNVVPCCWICNHIKSNVFSYDEMCLLGFAFQQIRTTWQDQRPPRKRRRQRPQTHRILKPAVAAQIKSSIATQLTSLIQHVAISNSDANDIPKVPRETRKSAELNGHRPVRLTCQDLIGWRSRMRLSQAEFARSLSIDASTVKRWESGHRALPPYLALVLDRLEFDLD